MRIRTIKPEFWTSADINSVSPLAQLLAVGLLNYADDDGYFDPNPRLIKAAIFPLRDNVTAETIIPGLLRELYWKNYAKCGKVEPNGVLVAWLPTFAKHQVISHHKPSKYNGLQLVELKVLEPSSNGPALGALNGIELNGTGNGTIHAQPTLGAGVGTIEATPSTPTAPEKVRKRPKVEATEQEELLYQLYPRKQARQDGLRAIRSALLTVPFDMLLEAVGAYAESQKGRPDMEHVPYPASWFNGKRWEDDRSGWSSWRNANGGHKPDPDDDGKVYARPETPWPPNK
jgi:hypothetical protein